MSAASPSSSLVVGYILPPKQDVAETAEPDTKQKDGSVSEGEDDEEEEDEPEFLDMGEMQNLSDGGRLFQSSLPRRHEVDFFDRRSLKTLRVQGRFPLTDPWWEVTCRVGRPRSKCVALYGFPSYALRRDLRGEDGCSVLSLFLNACGVSPDHMKWFMEWWRLEKEVEGGEGGGNSIELSDVPEFLEEFGEKNKKNKEVAKSMSSSVLHSGPGVCVAASSLYPLVMRHLPTLLPRQFLELLGLGRRRDDEPAQEQADAPQAQCLLTRLEEVIDTEVWKMGFSHILYKDLGLIRCEARLEAFEACGLFQNIPQLQRQALQVYEQLKCRCQGSGSTYVERGDLEEHMRPWMDEVYVWEAVRFLKQHGIVQLERQKVVLQNFYTYETGIGERLAMLTRAEGSEHWRIRLDVRQVLRNAELKRRRARAEAEAKAAAEAEERAGTARRRETPGGGGELVNVTGPSHPESEVGRGGRATAVVNGDVATAGRALGDRNNNGQDERHHNREMMEMEAHPPQTHPSQNGGSSSSWDLNFDLTYSTPTLTPTSTLTPTPTLTQEAPFPGTDQAEVELELDPDQVRAAEMICANPVTVISGKGGCGKTTVVSLVFQAAMQQERSEQEEVERACQDFQNDPLDNSHPVEQTHQSNGEGNQQKEKKEEQKEGEKEDEEKVEVLLTAPTGRAASLLNKRTGLPAYTMHQVLFSYMHWKKLGAEKAKAQAQTEAQARAEGTDKRGPWKFRRVRALVVDEGSLVSVQILHSLLTILSKEACLQKFIMLGDVRQLPSIEPGNALYDLFHSLSRVRWSIEMRTNHRAESQLIVDNAGKIADMGQKRTYHPLDFDWEVDMNQPSPQTPAQDKRFIYIRVSHNDTAIQDAVALLLRRGIGLQDHKSSQFIAFRRKDCDLINELCCKHYVDHPTRNHKRRLDFRVGDKICCTRNNYVPDRGDDVGVAQKEPSSPAATQLATQDDDPQEGGSHTGMRRGQGKKEVRKERLCNGEIFYIIQDHTVIDESGRRKRYLLLDDGQGKELWVLFREVNRLCRLQHAWARTIHTFQGSEAETIVYVVGSGVAQDWRHVYTAVTRGQKRVYVVSRDADLEKAIRGHIKARNTRLAQLVRELVASQVPGPGQQREGLVGEDGENQPGFTQPNPATPSRRGPGFGLSQASQTPGPYGWSKDIKKEIKKETEIKMEREIKIENIKVEVKMKENVKIKEENEEVACYQMDTHASYLHPIAGPSGIHQNIKVEKKGEHFHQSTIDAWLRHRNNNELSSTMCRDVKREEDDDQDLDTSDACLRDDLMFSQAYKWSPMEEMEDPTDPGPSKVKDSSQASQGNLDSPVGSKRLAEHEGHHLSTPHKQARVASVHTPTGASSLGLLSLNSPSPAPFVKHLFPREREDTDDNAANPSPRHTPTNSQTQTPSSAHRFKPRAFAALWKEFVSGAASQYNGQSEEQEGAEGGAGPSNSHPQEASPSRRVPGFSRPHGDHTETDAAASKDDTLKVRGNNPNSQDLQDDFAFSQAYTWSPMSCGEDPSSAVANGSLVADRLDFQPLEEDDAL